MIIGGKWYRYYIILYYNTIIAYTRFNSEHATDEICVRIFIVLNYINILYYNNMHILRHKVQCFTR